MGSLHKYKPSLIKAKSWDEIEQFYLDLVSKGWQMESVISLIRFIRNDNQLFNKIFVCTSLDKLVISIYSPIELFRETIHIKYNHEKDLWNFKYYPHPYHDPEHEIDCSSESLIDRFRDFIQILGW